MNEKVCDNCYFNNECAENEYRTRENREIHGFLCAKSQIEKFSSKQGCEDFCYSIDVKRKIGESERFKQSLLENFAMVVIDGRGIRKLAGATSMERRMK